MILQHIKNPQRVANKNWNIFDEAQKRQTTKKSK